MNRAQVGGYKVIGTNIRVSSAGHTVERRPAVGLRPVGCAEKQRRLRCCAGCDMQGDEPLPESITTRRLEAAIGAKLYRCSEFDTIRDYWLEVSSSDGECPLSKWNGVIENGKQNLVRC